MRRQRCDALAASHVPKLDGLVERLRGSEEGTNPRAPPPTVESGQVTRDRRPRFRRRKKIIRGTPEKTKRRCEQRIVVVVAPHNKKKLTPETSKFDCGLKRHENTKLVCPLNSTNASPVSALHSLRVLSSLAVAMYDAVGDHATSG